MKTKATKLFDDAAAKLNQAKEEIFRPQEDLVSFVVCKNSQFAIENFLKGYLMNNNVDPSKYNTLDLLLSKCKKINKKFESISLSPLQCTSHDLETKICSDTEKVCSCFNVAENLSIFLKKEKIIE
ncbi:MAG: hypothetical protein COW67_08605 [Flavobacteriales bacterium CG18_big_fil_WC_8_21_14_2_50_32_9]|nr:hypothetical protein [Flavobacteriales bacterium]PIQ15397.1 MAG: hypothetical protein COW67_08605 [Flavobacteriales bacterium CG18_big_fil_WC_8_21_14_2_50_32_9]PIZ06830.1 MAG: hypothetical protein COY57_00010 [Flavobacteriales bacterium CG_4_10_14_0_8_um_filter_32_5]PJC62250.1 MAG: hypothetical protein CO022_05500 [Flavobacteriales bacterium CG_4_9_14_0_2_um_filter_32_27]